MTSEAGEAGDIKLLSRNIDQRVSAVELRLARVRPCPLKAIHGARSYDRVGRQAEGPVRRALAI